MLRKKPTPNQWKNLQFCCMFLIVEMQQALQPERDIIQMLKEAGLSVKELEAS